MRAAVMYYLSICFNMKSPEALPDAVTRIQLAPASRLMQIWPNGVRQKLGFTSQIFVSDNIRLLPTFVWTRPPVRSRTI